MQRHFERTNPAVDNKFTSEIQLVGAADEQAYTTFFRLPPVTGALKAIIAPWSSVPPGKLT